MDACNIERPGAVSQQKTAPAEDTLRPPLVPSEKNNAIPATARKQRTRDVASRYKSGISSTPVSTPKRCPSPTASRTSPSLGTLQPKRALSAERRRPSTPSSRLSAPSSPSATRPSTPSSPSSRSTTPVRDAVTEVHNTSRRLISSRAPDGLWPSMRSLSSSFQSESISVPISKRDKVVSNSSSDHTSKSLPNAAPERKRTPLRGRNTSDQSENSRPSENLHARLIDQHRWPSVMGGRVSGQAFSRSLDLTDKINGSVSVSVSSRGVSPKRMSVSDVAASLSVSSRGASPRRMSVSDVAASLSVSSRGVSPRRMSASDVAGKGLQHSMSDVVRRLTTDGNARAEREIGSGVIASSHPPEKSSSLARTSRTLSSPIPALHRPSSPNRALSTSSSTSRGMLSPSRMRSSTPATSTSSATSRAGATSSVLNYIVDVRKGKKNANQIEDAHQLRLLYNRDLQWRFVNAQADDTLSIQKATAESILYNVWNATSELRDSVILKTIDVQHLRLEMKLSIILKEQMEYLEHWVTMEREHCSSLAGAVEALRASTLRLPVTGGARADVLAVKNAVSSAVDVMQAMGFSICYLLSKVESTKSLVSELSVVAAKERAMLDECRELLACTAAIQVQESSLRTHLIQLRQDAYKSLYEM